MAASRFRTLLIFSAVTLAFVCVTYVYDSVEGDQVSVFSRLGHVVRFSQATSSRMTYISQGHGQGIAAIARREVSSEPGQIWVKYPATLTDRLTLYNYVIDQVRTDVIGNITSPHNAPPLPSTASQVFIDQSTYLHQLANRLAGSEMRTVYLQYMGPPLNATWDSRLAAVRQSLLVGRYYEWAGSGALCEWLRGDHYHFLHTSPCISRLDSAPASPVSSTATTKAKEEAGVDSMNVNYVTYQMFGGLDKPYMSHVHILTCATVSNIGDVFARDFKIVPPTCREERSESPPGVADNSVYDEVFVTAQYWGEGHFHKMMEDLPRLAPFLPFLLQHPNISIHVISRNAMTEAMLEALGIESRRIVEGDVHGHIVYLPRSSSCGHLLINEGQLLSQAYRNFIDSKLTGDKEWRSVVLIKRSGSRHLVRQADIEQAVSETASKYGFRFELFTDNPVPSAHDTMLMFYRARVIVAPHGAGLSNMLFSRPGTGVIEATCDLPLLNACYLMGAYHLGHRYHGLPTKGGCDGGINVEPSDVAAILDGFLRDMK